MINRVKILSGNKNIVINANAFKSSSLYLIMLLSLLISSCFKEDELITPHEPGDMVNELIEMGQYYNTQSYYDMGTHSIAKSNDKDIWDLAFACGDSVLEIRVNSAKFARIARVQDTSYFSIQDTSNFKWYFDVSSGNPDSVAIQNWFSIAYEDTTFSQNTFIIDKGLSAMGVPMGISKFKILNFVDNHYTIQYSGLDNSDIQIVDVPKVYGVNYTQLKLSKGEMPLNLEPLNHSWDLFFTQYTDILTTSDGEKYPYLVTGVLLNPLSHLAAIDTNLSFNDIQISDTAFVNFKTNQDVIGYKWKRYDFDSGIYTVLTKNNYIIRDNEGYYYKLRFIGFYNNLGQKGYPEFEFQQL